MSAADRRFQTLRTASGRRNARRRLQGCPTTL
jgi:hypothetical protein